MTNILTYKPQCELIMNFPFIYCKMNVVVQEAGCLNITGSLFPIPLFGQKTLGPRENYVRNDILELEKEHRKSSSQKCLLQICQIFLTLTVVLFKRWATYLLPEVAISTMEFSPLWIVNNLHYGLLTLRGFRATLTCSQIVFFRVHDCLKFNGLWRCSNVLQNCVLWQLYSVLMFNNFS